MKKRPTRIDSTPEGWWRFREEGGEEFTSGPNGWTRDSTGQVFPGSLNDGVVAVEREREEQAAMLALQRIAHEGELT